MISDHNLKILCTDLNYGERVHQREISELVEKPSTKQTFPSKALPWPPDLETEEVVLAMYDRCVVRLTHAFKLTQEEWLKMYTWQNNHGKIYPSGMHKKISLCQEKVVSGKKPTRILLTKEQQTYLLFGTMQ